MEGVVGVGWVKHLQEIVEDINSYFHRLLNHPTVNETTIVVVAVAAAIAVSNSRSNNSSSSNISSSSNSSIIIM